MDETFENPKVVREDRPFLTGYMIIGILCAIAIALAIVGLASYSLMVSAITVIVLAAAFLLEGSSMVKFFQTSHRKSETAMETFELSAEVIGGAAGLVLGILALADILPVTLIAVSAIVYGAALILGSAFAPRFEESPQIKSGRTSLEILAGVVGVILGILALMNINPLALSLIAMIVLAVGTFLTEISIKNSVSKSYVRH
ncbi:MAG: hypothetical protein A2Y12_09925 [Planctomycetes bacterium GWF2_42_9]|nr:MAG: hypothetical protein A2Y12_09925 [Planctomycetes bacterium GWF2_42_9]